MTAQIDRHAMVTFAERVRLQAQQVDTKLLRTVERDDFDGEKKFFDRYGPGVMLERFTRGEENQPQELPRSRRLIAPRDFEFTEEFDLDKDPVRLSEAVKPDSQFQRAAAMSIGRQVDDLIIEALHGDALGGKEGDELSTFRALSFFTPTVFTPPGQRQLVTLLREFNVTGDLYCVIHPGDLNKAFDDFSDNIAQMITADVSGVRPYVTGELGRFLSAEFVESTRVTVDELDPVGAPGVLSRWVTMYAKSAVKFGIKEGSITSAWEKIPGRGNTWQFTLYGTMAAVRMFETHVARRAIPQ